MAQQELFWLELIFYKAEKYYLDTMFQKKIQSF